MKEKSIAHLIYVPFTGLGRIDRGDKWLENRIRIFKRYVLRSLMNQTKKEFIIWVSWRPQDRYNQLVIDLLDAMNSLEGLRTVFTYDGLCFYDDKYKDKEAKLRLFNNLTDTLPVLKSYIDWADEIYMTINASDDMYINSAIETLQNTDFGECRAIGWTQGYIIDYATLDIAEYNPDTIPPFFTIKFPKDTFLDARRHCEWIGYYPSHEYINKIGFKSLEGRGFVVGAHGENISTTFNIPYKGSIVDNVKVLLQIGALFTEAIKIKPSKRVVLRKIYNFLPFKSLIKKIYLIFKNV
jgi:hypothetical protein